jgi:hypothetical protein
MSIETFLVGEITLKKGVTERQARQLVKDISEYTEVGTAIEGTVDYEYYLRNMRYNFNGKALIIRDDSIDEGPMIRYHDISYSSHIFPEKIEALREKLKENKEIIREAAFSLYYLNEPDENIYYSSSAKEGK